MIIHFVFPATYASGTEGSAVGALQTPAKKRGKALKGTDLPEVIPFK